VSQSARGRQTVTHRTKGNKGLPDKQLNVRLPEYLHRQLKAKAALDGVPIAEAVEGLVRDYVEGIISARVHKD
jgi:predicted HicB family RNase H-like nuclease